MALVIDADTHIAEPPEMWNFLDPDWYPRRPVVVQVPGDTQYGGVDHMWLIDGVIYPSVQASADDGTAGGVNVVLFHAASRTQDAAGPALGSGQLWRVDSASVVFAPWLEPSPQAVKCGDSQRGFQHEDEFDAREITLRAIPAGTTVHRVKGNRVLTDWKAVSIGRRE